MDLLTTFSDARPYDNTIIFGHYLPEAERTGSFDSEKIDFTVFEASFGYKRVCTMGLAHIIAYLYSRRANLNQGIRNCTPTLPHAGRPTYNVVFGHETIGKTRMILECAFFALFRGLLPIILLQNDIGPTAMSNIFDEWETYLKALYDTVPSLENPVFELHRKVFSSQWIPMTNEIGFFRSVVICQRSNLVQLDKIQRRFASLESPYSSITGLYAIIKDETNPNIASILESETKRLSPIYDKLRTDFFGKSGLNVFVTSGNPTIGAASDTTSGVQDKVQAYRAAFERDLERAATGTVHMTNLYEKIEYWKTMILEAETLLFQGQFSCDIRKTWVTMCLLLVNGDKFRRTFKTFDYDDIKKDHELVSLVNLTRLRTGNGNSWRAISGTHHLVKFGNVYRLWQ